MKKPNIIIICSDQHSPRITGYSGHLHVKTPNLDRLAAKGTCFTQAYCNNPICTPSRMSFITGKYSFQINVPNNGFPLSPNEMTWARKLDESGYQSTMLGKMDFCGEYQDGGFTDYKIIRHRRVNKDLVDGTPPFLSKPIATKLRNSYRSWGTVKKHIEHAGPRTERIIPEAAEFGERDDFIGNYDHDKMVTQWAVEYLKEKGALKDEKPWALYIGLVYPHAPFTVPSKYFDMYYPNDYSMPVDYNTPNINLHPAMQHFQKALGVHEPTEEGLRRTIAAYYGMVTCMDDMIGEILDELENQDLNQDTYIIYTSDHGESLGEHGLFFKKCAYDSSVRVPLIIKGPDIPAGENIELPVTLIDMYPTIMDIAGIPCESDLNGESWLNLFNGGKSRKLDYAFSEYHGHLNFYDWFMLVRKGYKYIWYDRERPSLFNIKIDPNELEDLALNPAYKEVLDEFETLLRTIVNPEKVCYQAKYQQGLISQDGDDLSEKL